MNQYGRFIADRDGNIVLLKSFKKYDPPAPRLGAPVDLVIFTDEPVVESAPEAVKPTAPVLVEGPYDPKNPDRNYPGYL